MFIYSQLLPLGWRLRLRPLSDRVKLVLQWCCIMPRDHIDVWYRLSRRESWEHRVARARKLVHEKRVIRVAFQVASLSKWKADSLFRLMLHHERFEPVIWFVAYTRYNEEAVEAEYRRCADYCAEHGYTMVNYRDLEDFPEDIRPDLTFIHESYEFSAPFNREMTKHLYCFLGYGFGVALHRLNCDTVLNNGALFIYVSCRANLRSVAGLMLNKGVNLVYTGRPLVDPFLFPETPLPPQWKEHPTARRKVIWAPHWTLDAEQGNRFVSGTFLRTARIMQKLAQRHQQDIQFAFKPHPLLYSALCRHGAWGKQKTDAFYDFWRTAPNTQLEEGDYQALFMQSDAMIHDSCSFIVEYLLVDKPCMYLNTELAPGVFGEMPEQALGCYERGNSEEQIERFLQGVLCGEDRRAAQRAEFRKQHLIPPKGLSAAQNIVDHLLAL